MLELARPGDRAAVEQLAQQMHGQHVVWRPDIYIPADCLYPEARFQVEMKARQLYVAKLGDMVLGYARVKIQKLDSPGLQKRRIMLICEFCVRENCRNQGIGAGMMEDLRALAKAFGCTDLQLEVYPQNDEAVGFWQKCGFTIRSIEMQQKL